MITQKQRRSLKSALIFAGLTAPLCLMTNQANSAVHDPYINSFATYAAEIKALESVENGDTSNTFSAYADDVQTVEKSAGYIGDELPIPKAIKVMDGVYTVVGSFIWGTPANFGLNNNLSAVIFDDGVFIYNGGPNEAVAYSFHQQIKRITNKPVKWLAVENDQGHAYLGSSYWYDIGVKNLYSEKRANDHFHLIFDETKDRYAKGRGPAITQSVYDVTGKFTTFTDAKTIDVGGGETVQLINFGGGHTPSMTGMYIPSRKLLFTGDLGFNERVPGLLEDSHFREWISSFEKMVSMVPEDVTVIPGHGTPTDLATLKRQTYDYFVELYQEVQKVVDTGGNLADIDAIDQSKHQDRPVFDQLSVSNARHIYNELMTEKQAQQ